MSEQRIPHAISHPVRKGPAPKPRPLCLNCGKTCATLKRRYCSVACSTAHKPRRRSLYAPESSVAPARAIHTPPPGSESRGDAFLCVTEASPEPCESVETKPEGPPHKTSTGDGLATYRKKKSPWPMGDPELCVHPARPVDYLDGYAIVAEWAKLGISGQHFVRGWTCSVTEDAAGLVYPKFETPGCADLFTKMCDARTGRRTERAA